MHSNRAVLSVFASDIDSYVNWTISHCQKHADFEWQARSAADWRTPFAGWTGTRYEAKALREERTPAYLTFRRRPAKGVIYCVCKCAATKMHGRG